MTRPSYVLTHAAEIDARDIIRHTRQEWGDDQVCHDVTKLQQGMVRLAAGQGRVKDMGILYPTLRMVRCEHHDVFGLPRTGAAALIVAILQQRMNLMARLADRL